MNDLVHRRHERERHALDHLVGNPAQIFLVRLGQDHLTQAGAVSSHHFLFDPADLQHFPAQCHLARQRQVTTHRATTENAGNRQRYSSASARSVLWNRTRREVNMEVDFLELGVVDAKGVRARANVGIRSIN